MPIKHLHELKRIYQPRRGDPFLPPKQRVLRDYTWKCNDPNCFAKFRYDDIIGKQSLCTNCHSRELSMDKYNVTLANPKCMYCSNTLAAKKLRAAAEVGQSLVESLITPNLTSDGEPPLTPLDIMVLDIDDGKL